MAPQRRLRADEDGREQGQVDDREDGHQDEEVGKVNLMLTG